MNSIHVRNVHVLTREAVLNRICNYWTSESHGNNAGNPRGALEHCMTTLVLATSESCRPNWSASMCSRTHVLAPKESDFSEKGQAAEACLQEAMLHSNETQQPQSTSHLNVEHGPTCSLRSPSRFALCFEFFFWMCVCVCSVCENSSSLQIIIILFLYVIF